MSRVALTKNLKLILAAVAAVVVIGGGVTTYAVMANSGVQTVTNAQHQLTQISYRGENGTDALTLLKKRATVEVKHYSFGDQVVSINGTSGNGPKYWTFYVNGKESSVGASAYVTKNSDTLKWELR